MKTIENLKDEINSIIKSQPRTKPSRKNKELYKDYSRAQKRVSWLNQCILYLETFPDIEFLSDQRNKKYQELKSIDNGFSDWQINTPHMLNHPKAKQIYNKSMDRKKVYDHLNTLEYILS